MPAKELIEARWKLAIGLLLALVTVVSAAFTYESSKAWLSGPGVEQIPDYLRAQLEQTLSSYDAFIWSQWFAGNGIVPALAALLGGALIAGEVSRSTIFLLLSKPLSRERILLLKYGVSAGMLLAVLVVGDLVLLAVTALLGHPQPLLGNALSTLLFWLGTLSVLGVATLLSVVFNDVLRPVALALVVSVLLGLPGLLPGGENWNLPRYWASLPAYQGASFPTIELAVSLVAAVLPLAGALLLFRNKAY